MSAAVEVKTERKGRGRREVSLIPETPQVNLLPPEVVAARGIKVVKRWLGVAIVLALVVSAGVVALAWLGQQAADQLLVEEQAETARLQAEREKYVEVPLVLGEIDRVATARLFGMSTEVEISRYLDAIAATAPEDVAIDTVLVQIDGPTTAAGEPADPLASPRIGSITFHAESATVPDTAEWLDTLAAIPGFTDAWFTAASITEDADGVSFYSVDATVSVDSDAYALRFLEVE